MASQRRVWTDFGWQGIRLRVPDDWNLGRLDGDYRSGYVRLDDAEIVRAEVEWREGRGRDGSRLALQPLVDRYVESLARKAQKAGMGFSARRDARFVADPRWLEGTDHQLFTWEADYRAYNLAQVCPSCGRIVLLRVLGRLDEDLGDLPARVFRSLQDHPDGDQVFWSVYGMTFRMPADFHLSASALRSGHLQLTFEKDRQTCHVHRLSLARMLLRGGRLEEWYPFFFKKQLRDLHVEVRSEAWRGHPGMHLEGRPRSRWRQVLRPLPWLNPRPRQHQESVAWQCETSDKICAVDYLYRRRTDRSDLLQRVIDGYICHQEQPEAESRGHVELAAGAQ